MFLVLLPFWCPKDTCLICLLRATTQKGGSWKILFMNWKWNQPVTLNILSTEQTRIPLARASFDDNLRFSQTFPPPQCTFFPSKRIIQSTSPSSGRRHSEQTPSLLKTYPSHSHCCFSWHRRSGPPARKPARRWSSCCPGWGCLGPASWRGRCSLQKQKGREKGLIHKSQ